MKTVSLILPFGHCIDTKLNLGFIVYWLIIKYSRSSLQRSMSPRTLRKYNSTARLDGNSDSPPGSPGTYRRSNSREESSGKNVFSRLIAGTRIGENQSGNKGVINPYQGRIVAKSPLICTNVAEGHTKAVLSVFATDELLFSASKDRTVKVKETFNLQF